MRSGRGPRPSGRGRVVADRVWATGGRSPGAPWGAVAASAFREAGTARQLAQGGPGSGAEPGLGTSPEPAALRAATSRAAGTPRAGRQSRPLPPARRARRDGDEGSGVRCGAPEGRAAAWVRGAETGRPGQRSTTTSPGPAAPRRPSSRLPLVPWRHRGKPSPVGSPEPRRRCRHRGRRRPCPREVHGRVRVARSGPAHTARGSNKERAIHAESRPLFS